MSLKLTGSRHVNLDIFNTNNNNNNNNIAQNNFEITATIQHIPQAHQKDSSCSLPFEGGC